MNRKFGFRRPLPAERAAPITPPAPAIHERRLIVLEPDIGVSSSVSRAAGCSMLASMTKTVLRTAAVVLCLSAAALLWPQASDDPLDSLKVCAATQHLIFENQFVRVIDDVIPAGVAEPL